MKQRVERKFGFPAVFLVLFFCFSKNKRFVISTASQNVTDIVSGVFDTLDFGIEYVEDQFVAVFVTVLRLCC